MYLCLDCGNIFSEPKRFREVGSEDIPFDEWCGCPECGGNYATLHICDRCGEAIATDHFYTIDGETYCEKCCEEHRIDEWAVW